HTRRWRLGGRRAAGRPSPGNLPGHADRPQPPAHRHGPGGPAGPGRRPDRRRRPGPDVALRTRLQRWDHVSIEARTWAPTTGTPRQIWPAAPLYAASVLAATGHVSGKPQANGAQSGSGAVTLKPLS